jgi:hypothetical protein
MATEFDICNKALHLIGGDGINSFADASRESQVCKSLYEMTLDNLITEHPWGFTKAFASLNRLVETPLYGFKYAYQLPPKCLRVLSAEGADRYQVVENKLYCDAAELSIEYQFRPDVNRFPVYFERVLVFELAADLALSLAEDRSKSNDLWNKAIVYKRKARHTDSGSQPSRGIRESNYDLITARMV